MSFHTILIVGHLGRDPEMRFTPTGQPVTHLSLACNRPLQPADGQPLKETTWFKVSVWGKQAETCNEFLQKGSLVLVEGRLICDPETGGPRIFTRQDGAPGVAFEVNAVTVRFLSGSDDSAGEEEASAMKEVAF